VNFTENIHILSLIIENTRVMVQSVALPEKKILIYEMNFTVVNIQRLFLIFESHGAICRNPKNILFSVLYKLLFKSKFCR